MTAVAHEPPGGDPDGDLITALWAEHGPALLGYTTRLVGDPQLAEDIVQEVLVRSWKHADRLDGHPASLRPWLFTVAGRLAIDHHRARRARPPEVPDAALEGRPAADGIDRAIDAWELAAALDSLSPGHRAVLDQTYYQGRSVAQAAKALGIPEGTVKSRAYYALRTLRLALEERGWTV